MRFASGGMCQSVRKLEHNRPDMRVWLKKSNRLFVVEMCTPCDENVKARQEEKAKKYVPLAAELASECARGAEVSRVTLVIGAGPWGR